MSEARDPAGRPIFDDYPYLMTRIGSTPLRHIALLRSDRSPDQLLDLARRQARANHLDTCLCLGPGKFVYLFADGQELMANDAPWGMPVAGLLKTAEDFPVSPEDEDRERRLREFAERHRQEGYLVGDGLEAGRPASAVDMTLMQRRGEDGVPTSLHRCRSCQQFRGEYLAVYGEGNGDKRPRVVFVHCACDNHNRCARCGSPLADHRLSSYSYDEQRGAIMYTAAYVGLSHRCPTEQVDASPSERS